MKNEKDTQVCTKLKKVAVGLILTAVACFVGAALTPPMWYVDGSILTGMGIIFGYAALMYAWEATDRGIDAKLTHGNTTIELNNPDTKKENEQ